MDDIESKITEAQKKAERRKGIIPNIFRLSFNLIFVYFIPNELYFFINILSFLCLCSALWFISELLLSFNYKKYWILPYLPASADLITAFILVYITGCGNSIFITVPLSILVVSSLFSPDSKQSYFLLISSLLLFFLLLTGLYFRIIPFINVLNFENSDNVFPFIFSFLFFSLFFFGLFIVVRSIGKVNLDLNKKLEKLTITADEEKIKSNRLLLNILPFESAIELKENGFVKPVLFDSVSILFTDFKGFTKIAEKMSPEDLLKTLDTSFSEFDKITEKYNLEKLKTIGDSYMCAGGIPIKNKTHPIDICLAALEFQSLMNKVKEMNIILHLDFWELRIGIHCGPVVAGVVGKTKFAYDIWGDAVNTASRMESSGTAGEINISESIFDFVDPYFECEHRGKINAKGKGEIDMYYLKRIRVEYAKDESGLAPNKAFSEIYRKLI